jgi:2-polyprenyl-3-methyl-5-hydroxy-6-metoxy-1,4-benzoquinol methylase
MLIDTAHRSQQTEIMDDLDMTGELLRNTLDLLAKINRQLGGNRVTVSGVKRLLSGTSLSKEVTIVDFGCGDGDMLRILADMLRQSGRPFKLIGLDANAYTIAYAKAQSKDYPEISFLQMDVFSDQMQELEYDIALATLFMHHFSNKEIEALLRILMSKVNVGIVINDLHRSRLAYYLFKGYGLFIKNTMIKNDGAISILRAFKRVDLERFASKLGLNSEIRWKWAFRYQWVIKTI